MAKSLYAKKLILQNKSVLIEKRIHNVYNDSKKERGV